MNTLTSTQSHHLLQRFPKIELSYEIIPHKKVSNNYNVCIGIPSGTKCYAWFTFFGDEDVCFIMEINKERKINKVSYMPLDNTKIQPLSLGTLFYGTFIDFNFVIEDVFLYKGLQTQGLYYGEKLGFLENLFTKDQINTINTEEHFINEHIAVEHFSSLSSYTMNEKLLRIIIMIISIMLLIHIFR
jgi:hypothetical protein